MLQPVIDQYRFQFAIEFSFRKKNSNELLPDCTFLLELYLQSTLLPFYEDQTRFCSRMTLEWNTTFPLSNNLNASILSTVNTSYSSAPARLVVTEFFFYPTAQVIDGVGIVQNRRSLFWYHNRDFYLLLDC